MRFVFEFLVDVMPVDPNSITISSFDVPMKDKLERTTIEDNSSAGTFNFFFFIFMVAGTILPVSSCTSLAGLRSRCFHI
jgi:hypothetical protein